MTAHASAALETKAANDPDLKDAFDDFLGAFGAFREANDERLAELERKLSADVVTEEKVERINAALDSQKRLLDRLVLKGSRPELGSRGSGRALEASEHKAAFEAYVRIRRDDRAEAARGEGGLDRDLARLAATWRRRKWRRRSGEGSRSSRRSVRSPASAPCRPTSTASPSPRPASRPAGWARPTRATETNTPTLVELEYPVMELYAMPAATQTLLDDTAIDIDQWIASEVEMAFAEQELAAFVNGDADKKPKGFLDYLTVAEASWVWGKLGYVITGVSADFAADPDASDVLVDAVYALKAGYRQNAYWVMNRKTQGAIRKLKDDAGNYIWSPPATADGRATIMNFPVAEAEDMPDIGADSLSIAFGDFSRGYLIVDRLGVRVLRDPYSQKPYVLFYTTKRVGGGVQDFDAIKLIKFGTA